MCRSEADALYRKDVFEHSIRPSEAVPLADGLLRRLLELAADDELVQDVVPAGAAASWGGPRPLGVGESGPGVWSALIAVQNVLLRIDELKHVRPLLIVRP